MRYHRIADARILVLLILGIMLLCPWSAADSDPIPFVMFESEFVNNTQTGALIQASGDVQAEAVSPPVALFTVSRGSGPVPLTIQFTDHSTGNPTQWGWYFGDGGTSHEQNPEHTYTSPGTYPVGFLVANSAGYNKTFVPGMIQAQNPVPTPTPVPAPVQYPPTAGFMASPVTGPVPLTVLFIDTSSDKPDSWAWYFGDGGYSPRQHPYHTYTRPGTYPVSLTVSNKGGSDTFIAENYIQAATPVPTPTPRPTITPICPLILGQSEAVLESVLPVAKFNATVIEASDIFTVQFTDESVGDPVFYLWYFGDGSYTTEKEPVYTYTSPGTYQVSLMVVNDAGSSTMSGWVEVQTGDVAADAAPDPTPVPVTESTPLSHQAAEIVANDPGSWSGFLESWNTSTGRNMPPVNGIPGRLFGSGNLNIDALEKMTQKKV